MADENKKKAATAVANGEDKPFLSAEDVITLKTSLLKDYKEADQTYFIHVCERTRLDPFTNQIWARPEKNEMSREGKFMKMLCIAGIQGFLTVADRSGVYDGSDPIEWCAKNGDWLDVWLQDGFPFAARARVWRKDHSRPEVSIVRWKAVANEKQFEKNFWLKMPDYMLGKCALAAALRKLFPNQLSGLYETSEIAEPELQATTLEVDIAKQKERIAEDAVATERLKTQGVAMATPAAPTAPRDAVKEVIPAKMEDVPEPDFDIEPDGRDGEEPKQRPEGWWMDLSCDLIKNKYYNGKTIQELSMNLLSQAVEKWVPKVRQPDTWVATTQEYRDLVEGLELGLAEAQRVQARAETKADAEGT